MKSLYQLLTLLILLCVMNCGKTESQDHLVGPIVVGTPVGGGHLLMHDIGANQVWEVNIPNGYTMYSWSPDGCNILFRGSPTWALFSLSDLSVELIPANTPISHVNWSIGSPRWHPDGKTLLFSINERPNEDRTRLYLFDAITKETQLFYTFENPGFGFAKRWLSDIGLLLKLDDTTFVWDQSTQQAQPYESEIHPPNYTTWNLPYYALINTEDNRLWARYFAIRTYNQALNSSNSEEYTEIFGPIEDVEPKTGFDLYVAETGEVRHIQFKEQFLQSLTISPSGDFVVAATYPPTTSDKFNGFYIYDIERDAITQIGTFPAIYNSEYGPYEPSWSIDENFISIYSSTGPNADAHLLIDLSDNSVMTLDEQFNSAYRQVSWSPIMSYEQNACY